MAEKEHKSVVPITRETARDRIWRSIRSLKRFTSNDLVATATAKPANVEEYLLALVDAGFVRIEREGHQGARGRRVYALAVDQPKAPRLPIEQIKQARRRRPS